MGYTFVIDTEAKSTDQLVATTPAVDTTGATLIVIATSNDNAAAVVTDSKSNTWTPVDVEIGTAPRLRLFYCVNPTVGSGHTFTNDPTGGVAYPSIAVAAFSSGTTPALDQHSQATAVQPGSITPGFDNEVLVTCAINNGSSSEAPPSAPFSSNVTADLTGDANSYTLAMAYEIQTTATARNPTWQNFGGIQTAIASFTETAGGGVVPVIMNQYRQRRN